MGALASVTCVGEVGEVGVFGLSDELITGTIFVSTLIVGFDGASILSIT